MASVFRASQPGCSLPPPPPLVAESPELALMLGGGPKASSLPAGQSPALWRLWGGHMPTAGQGDREI